MQYSIAVVRSLVGRDMQIKYVTKPDQVIDLVKCSHLIESVSQITESHESFPRKWVFSYRGKSKFCARSLDQIVSPTEVVRHMITYLRRSSYSLDSVKMYRSLLKLEQ
jgi:hypothetical protein